MNERNQTIVEIMHLTTPIPSIRGTAISGGGIEQVSTLFNMVKAIQPEYVDNAFPGRYRFHLLENCFS